MKREDVWSFIAIKIIIFDNIIFSCINKSRHILLLYFFHASNKLRGEESCPYDYHISAFFNSAITIVRLNKAYITNYMFLQEWLSSFPPRNSIMLLRNGWRREEREVLRLAWFMLFLITGCRHRLFFNAVRMPVKTKLCDRATTVWHPVADALKRSCVVQ